MLFFLTTYITIDFMTEGLTLMNRGTPFMETIKFFVYKTPLIIIETMPMSTLIATLFTLGILSRNNEVSAFKASGVSAYYISAPILVISIIISITSMMISEYVLPTANKISSSIWEGKTSKTAAVKIYKKNDIWYFGNKIIFKINVLDIKNSSLHGVTIFKTGKDFNFTKRIDAEKITWVNEEWTFYDGTERIFSNDTVKSNIFKKRQFKLNDKFSDFTVVAHKSKEMNLKELNDHINKLKKMGLDYNKYLVDMMAKIAFPLVNFIFPLIGISFSLKTGRNAGMASGVGISIIIGFTYWVTMAFNVSLGHVGVLPPVIAAFASNIIFGLIGILLILNVKT